MIRPISAGLFDAALPPVSRRCKGIVYLWGTEPPRDAADTPELAETAQRRALAPCPGTEFRWQSNARYGWSPKGSQAVHGGEPVQPAQAPIWGLGRTLLLEHPELECVCVDLSPEPVTDNLSFLLAELRGPAAEAQVAYRPGERYVAQVGAPPRYSQAGAPGTVSHPVGRLRFSRPAPAGSLDPPTAPTPEKWRSRSRPRR